MEKNIKVGRYTASGTARERGRRRKRANNVNVGTNDPSRGALQLTDNSAPSITRTWLGTQVHLAGQGLEGTSHELVLLLGENALQDCGVHGKPAT